MNLTRTLRSLPVSVAIGLLSLSSYAQENIRWSEEQAVAQIIAQGKARYPNANTADRERLICVMSNIVSLVYRLREKEFLPPQQVIADTDRLSSIPAAFNEAASKCVADLQTVDLDELQVDAAKLDGKRVTIRAYGQYVMGQFALKRKPTDMSPLFIDLAQVPRDQKLNIMRKCGDATSLCTVTLTGIVKDTQYQPSILAHSVTIANQ